MPDATKTRGRTVAFAQTETACRKGTVHNPDAAAVPLDFHGYSESRISDICFLCTEQKEAKEHRTLHNPIPHEPNRKPWSIKGPN